MSDFPPPSTPTPTYPAPHTAPFPSLHPQTGKVCHREQMPSSQEGGGGAMGRENFDHVPVGAGVRNRGFLSFQL